MGSLICDRMYKIPSNVGYLGTSTPKNTINYLLPGVVAMVTQLITALYVVGF